MTDYRALVAPFLESIRTEHTTPQTVKAYTDRLNTSIDCLEQTGREAPSEEYYTALEESLLSDLAKSTTASRVRLARKFFTWAQGQEGDRQIDMNDCIHEEVGTIEQEPVIPPLSSVEAEEQPAFCAPELPQEEEAGQEEQRQTTGRPRKSPEGRSRKLTLYLTPALDDDVKDLARIQRLSTPDYIFRLIERERDRRANALATFRALEEQ